MSKDQEAPQSQIDAENEAENKEHQHTEVGEHEYTIDELKQELAEAKQKAHDNWDKAVRIQAEMENLKKRTQKDLEDAHKFALAGFAKELLSVLDSLVLGLQAARGDSEDVQKFRVGSEMTIKQFESAFAKFNIDAIDPMGQPFNPECSRLELYEKCKSYCQYGGCFIVFKPAHQFLTVFLPPLLQQP